MLYFRNFNHQFRKVKNIFLGSRFRLETMWIKSSSSKGAHFYAKVVDGKVKDTEWEKPREYDAINNMDFLQNNLITHDENKNEILNTKMLQAMLVTMRDVSIDNAHRNVHKSRH